MFEDDEVLTLAHNISKIGLQKKQRFETLKEVELD